MKKKAPKFRSPVSYEPEKGSINNDKSLTMPNMSANPRKFIEDHVRGINPITGAVLDRQHYYGDSVIDLKKDKDLTYEELHMKKEALQAKAYELQEFLNDKKAEADARAAAEAAQTMGASTTVSENGGTV